MSGTVLERYEYDAYGSPTIWNADFTTERDNSNFGNPYLFTGRRVDILDSGSLKLQYNRNRYYDYYTGRWLTHDPLGYVDGMNLYEYVGSNPVLQGDPRGLISLRFGLSMCSAGLRIMRTIAHYRSIALALGVPPMLDTGHPYEHCVSACNLTRTWGRPTATAVLDIKEDIDEEVADFADTISDCMWWALRLTWQGHMATTNLSDWVCSAHQKSDGEDNDDGMDCGDKPEGFGLSCEDCCIDKKKIGPKTEEGNEDRPFGKRCQGRYKKAMEEKLGREVEVEDPK